MARAAQRGAASALHGQWREPEDPLRAYLVEERWISVGCLVRSTGCSLNSESLFQAGGSPLQRVRPSRPPTELRLASAIAHGSWENQPEERSPSLKGLLYWARLDSNRGPTDHAVAGRSDVGGGSGWPGLAGVSLGLAAVSARFGGLVDTLLTPVAEARLRQVVGEQVHVRPQREAGVWCPRKRCTWTAFQPCERAGSRPCAGEHGNPASRRSRPCGRPASTSGHHVRLIDAQSGVRDPDELFVGCVPILPPASRVPAPTRVRPAPSRAATFGRQPGRGSSGGCSPQP